MATMPAFFKRTDKTAGVEAPAARPDRNRALADPFQLRSLPHEDVFFYCKKIDNSRLVRVTDPKSRGACLSAIGAACMVLALLTGVLAPRVASTVAGYKIENLRTEEGKLKDERRLLELQLAALQSPQRLQQLAEGHFVAPSSNQVVHLDKPDSAVAMVKK